MTEPLISPSPYRLVVFDFDGTLADSARWMRGVIDQMAIKHRFKRVHDDEIEMLRGRGTREILAYLGIEAWRLPFIARDVRRLSAAAAPSLSLFEGVPALLQLLHARGIGIAVVTSNAEETSAPCSGRAPRSLATTHAGPRCSARTESSRHSHARCSCAAPRSCASATRPAISRRPAPSV